MKTEVTGSTSITVQVVSTGLWPVIAKYEKLQVGSNYTTPVFFPNRRSPSPYRPFKNRPASPFRGLKNRPPSPNHNFSHHSPNDSRASYSSKKGSSKETFQYGTSLASELNKKRRARENRKIAQQEVLIVDNKSESPDLEVISRSPSPAKSVPNVPKTESVSVPTDRPSSGPRTPPQPLSQVPISSATSEHFHHTRAESRLPRTPPEVNTAPPTVKPNGVGSEQKHHRRSMSTLPQLPLPDVGPEDEGDIDPSPSYNYK